MGRNAGADSKVEVRQKVKSTSPTKMWCVYIGAFGRRFNLGGVYVYNIDWDV